MPDDPKAEDNTMIRKIKSENELDQIDDSILDQVSGGMKRNVGKDEEEEEPEVLPIFDPTTIFE